MDDSRSFPDYLAANFTVSEWAAAFSCDPKGKKGKLIPVKVKPVEASKLGLFGSIIHIDLTCVSSKEEAKNRLVEQIRASEDAVRNKPEEEPSFHKTLLKAAETNHHQGPDTQVNKTENSITIKKKNLKTALSLKLA